MPKTLFHRAACVAAVSSAVVLGAASAPATAQDLDKVLIATNSFSLAMGPLSLATADPSIFEEYGIDLEAIAIQGSSSNCIAVLLSGDADLCQVGTTTGTDAIAEGAPLKGIAVITGPINEIILSKQAVEKLGISPDAPIEERAATLKDLRLVTAGPGSPHYMSLGAILNIAGLSMDDVQFRTLLDVTAMIESMRNGAIDGALWSVGSLGQMLMDDSGVRWISMAQGDIEELKTLPYVTVYAREDWIEKNGDLANRINAAFAASIEELKTNGAEASAKFKAMYFPDLDQALWDDGFAQAQQAYLDGAKGGKEGWDQFLNMQREANPNKDYSNAEFDKALIPAARQE